MIRFLENTPQMGEQVPNDDRYSNANLVEHPSLECHPSSERPSRKFQWKAGEYAADGLKRIIAEQLQLAILELSADRGELDHAVHEARKCLKKCRSALRLLQNLLGKEYKQGNIALRDAGRRLSPVRDSQALIEVFDKLNDEYRVDLGARSLIAIRNGLVRRKNRLSHEFQQKGTHTAVLKTLQTFATRVDKWKFNKAELPVLSKSLARTVWRNRQACQIAYAESRAESFHEWRKRAKDLRYYLNLVSKAWPVVLDGCKAAAKDIEGRLGDDHDLAVMRDTILQESDAFGNEEDINAFLEIVDQHQKKLRSECRMLADRFYSEKSKSRLRR